MSPGAPKKTVDTPSVTGSTDLIDERDIQISDESDDSDPEALFVQEKSQYIKQVVNDLKYEQFIEGILKTSCPHDKWTSHTDARKHVVESISIDSKKVPKAKELSTVFVNRDSTLLSTLITWFKQIAKLETGSVFNELEHMLELRERYPTPKLSAQVVQSGIVSMQILAFRRFKTPAEDYPRSFADKFMAAGS